MRRQFVIFLLRWLLNSFGLWIAFRLFGTGYDAETVDASVGLFLLAGLIFSLVNSILRPVVIVLSLPAILVTLGLFTFIVNGLMVYISLLLTPGLQMKFWHSVLTGIVLSLINYIVSSAVELRYEAIRKETKVMELGSVLQFITLGSGILMIVCVLLQQRGASLGAGFGSSGELYTTRRGLDKSLFDATIVLAVVFVLSILAALLLPGING